MAKRKALGKGLGALIPEVAPASGGGRLLELDLDQLEPNPDQPRRKFDAASLAELAASIRTQGIVQPLVVRRAGEKYRIIVGERRWRAAQLARLRSVPALLHDTDDTGALELALVENIHREDLNPIEEATAYRMLVDRLGLTQEQVAERVGKRRSTVANAMRLLLLPEGVQGRLREGSIDMGHARALLALEDPARQLELCEEAVRKGLTVRQVERGARQAAAGRKAPRPRAKDAFVLDVERRLSDALEAPVSIRPGGGTTKRGRIEIGYFSEADLQRLVDLLMGGKSGRRTTLERKEGL